MPATDTSLTAFERAYFLAVATLALWVGAWGWRDPTRIEMAIPWLVPPLHARFLGSMYLSGALAVILAGVAPRWGHVRLVVPMSGLWTGALLGVSLVHLGLFRFWTVQTSVWFAAYIAFPLGALLVVYKRRQRPPREPAVPPVARRLLLGQGVGLSVLGLCLVLMPDFMSRLWPWHIPSFLAQLYGAPFAAYGVGSLLVALRGGTLSGLIPVAAIGLFAILVLAASYLHFGLFDLSEATDVLWFVGFGALAIAQLGLAAGMLAATVGAVPAAEGRV